MTSTDTGNRNTVTETVLDRDVVKTDISSWKLYQKVFFRIAFIFFILMSIPSSKEWWNRTLALDWFNLNYRDVYDIARFLPEVPGLQNYSKGLKSYNDWFVILGIAVAGGIIWSMFDKRRREYNKLYYWLRVIVRYRAAIGMIGFGMQKVFPVQMAYPPISTLNTPFGDMTMQKLYWWEFGIAPFYQSFTGFVEVGAGLLLLHRKTTFFGAVLLAIALGCINHVNVAYDGNVHVYSTYFVVFGLFLMIYYITDIYNLQFKEKYTIPNHYYPTFKTSFWRYTRTVLKTFNIILFLIYLPYLQYLNFIYDPYNQPSAPGVKMLRGYYEVTNFRINGREISYSPMDSTRWQDVAFEKWSTLTLKVNQFIPPDIAKREKDPEVKKYVDHNGFGFNSGAPQRDIDRTYEVFAANRRSFYYRADTVNRILYLQDKATYVNPADSTRYKSSDPKHRIYHDDWISAASEKNMVSEINTIPEAGRSTRRVRAYTRKVPLDKMRDRMVLHYDTDETGKNIVLKGVNENNDSIQVVLRRLEKKYLLPESVFVGGKYD